MRKETDKTERIQAALRLNMEKNRTRAREDGMILDEGMTQNLQKELKELNEKNGEENDNLCHE